jgi:hypothetical protein
MKGLSNKMDDLRFDHQRDFNRGKIQSPGRDRPTVYEFRISSSLSPKWAGWFNGLEISYDDQGNTLMRGAVGDQTALHGILSKIRDLNLILISLTSKEWENDHE